MENIIILLLAITVATTATAFVLQFVQDSFSGQQISVLSNLASIPAAKIYIPPQKLSNPPEIIKGIYVTGYSAGSKKYLDYLSGLFKNTEINAVVVNIKGSDGYATYNSGAPDVQKYGLYYSAIKDIDALVRFFHDKNIYVIGRIAVFEDPGFSKARPELAIYDKSKSALTDNSIELSDRLWKDNNGLSWLDPASKEVWDYNISLAKDALYHGFDEINFDYIRFPSDGNIKNMGFPVWDGKTSKADVIKSFFEYVHQQLAGDPPPSRQGGTSAWRGKISVDLFGQTTTNTDDMGIGQVIEDAFENFDYISPMVYPSHYIDGFMGFDNPADHPYNIVNYEMSVALQREKTFLDKLISTPGVGTDVNATINLAKFRPWLQDFNMGAYYTAEKVEAEIKATQDALGNEYVGYMLWNPSNIYTEGAILKPN